MVNSLLTDSVEPELYPNSPTFVNFLDITDSDLLRSKEADFTGIRLIELFQKPTLIEQSFDFQENRIDRLSLEVAELRENVFDARLSELKGLTSSQLKSQGRMSKVVFLTVEQSLWDCA